MLRERIMISRFLLVFFLLIVTISVVFAASKEIRDKIVEITIQQIGKPYVLGTAGPNVFDCSGLVNYAYKNAGIEEFAKSKWGPHGAIAKNQYYLSDEININELLPGDLLFEQNTFKPGISHVGIYIGDGYVIEAANPRDGVIKHPLSRWTDSPNFAGARRVKAE